MSARTLGRPCPKCGWFHMWGKWLPSYTPGWLGRLFGRTYEPEAIRWECGACGYSEVEDVKP